MKPYRHPSTANDKIAELTKAIITYKTEPTISNIREVKYLLENLLFVKPSGSFENNLRIGQLALEAERLRLASEEDGHISWPTANRLIEVFSQNGVIETLAQDDNNRALLAYICHVASNKRLCNLANASPAKARQVISRWVGETISDEVKKSPARICDLFYGTGAWDLLSPEHGNDGSLARHLYHLGLPVHIKKPPLQVPVLPCDAELPSDFTL